MREWPPNGRGASSFGLFDDLFDRFFDESWRNNPRTPRRAEQVDITGYFSDTTNQVVQRAAEFARQSGSELTTEHLLRAVLDDQGAQRVLQQFNADPERMRQALPAPSSQVGAPSSEVPELTASAKRALLAAYQVAREMGATYIGPEHVILALALDQESPAGQLLAREGVTAARLQDQAVRGRGGEQRAPSSSTPTLDQYSRDLTAIAREGKLDPVVGRADEIEQAIEILSRRTKNNPVLIGEPGVGKTAIVEGIAQRIVNNEIPDTLAGRRLLALDLSGVIAGTQYRGQFEERMKQIIDEIKAHSDELIVFLDELHTVVGAGAAEGSMDASNMLKPALARGELHVVGATTLDEYRKHIEKDAALERRFQPVLVHEPTVEETIAILRGLRDRYEAFHRVKITDEAIVGAAELSDRYIRDRFLPDKAIDLVDQAAARVRLRSKTKPEDRKADEDALRHLERERDQAVADENFEQATELRDRIRERRDRMQAAPEQGAPEPQVTLEDIAEVASRATGIPVSQLNQEERARLLNLEERLHERIVGQEQAVSAVAESVRRARSGLGDPNQPIGSFLFLGPTGVGKTELARTLAEALFGDENQVIRLDMSEFQERHTVSRLVGSPPGYIGYDEAGQLTEAVRRKPYSVLLLDEIEKAHPDVFNILLQLLDDGRLTDSHGRTVDFKNTIVIMTSNLGSDRIMANARSGGSLDSIRDELMQLLRRTLRPEFLNRIDEIIIFHALSEAQVKVIARLIFDRVARRLRAQDIEAEFTDAAAEVIAKEGFDPDFGARPLKRAVQRLVENRLSRMVLEGELNQGDRVIIDAKDGELQFEVRRGATADATPREQPAEVPARA